MKPNASSPWHSLGSKPNWNNLSPLLFIVLPVICLLLLGACIYRDFVFGHALLLYKDMGSDSINDSYPWFLHFSDYLRSEGLPSWSYYVGMGQDIFYLIGYLLFEPVTWLPREWIAHALVYQHLLKALVAGLLFFRFLQLRGLVLPACLLGSLLLSFSSYMCMGSCWFILADEVVCFSALLYAVEVAVKRGRWFVLSLAVCLVPLVGSFYLYLCALFLFFYVPSRLFEEFGWRPRRILRNCLLLAAAASLGVGLGAVVAIPNLYTLLNSPRGSGTTSNLTTLGSFPLFGLESHLHYLTATLRPFSHDLLGTANSFRGWNNYLEAPLTYCGLVCLILLPQVFVGATRRQRLVYASLVATMLIPTIFPWFRYLFWAFQGDYYRTYSLFWVLGVVTLSVVALSRYLQVRAINLWLLGATVIVLMTIINLPFGELQSRIDPGVKLQVMFLLVSYGVILTGGQLLKRNKMAAWLIVAVSVMELTQFDRVTVNRPTVTKQDLKARVGYNDETVDAVRYIKAGDESFYRISKPRPSGPTAWTSLNDAMVFGYFGTSCYSSFNNVNYTNFLTAVEAIPPNSEYNTRWSVGLLNDPILSTFACEKYVLADDPVFYQTILQYDAVRRYGINYLFRNQLSLPLGLVFNQFMAEKVFRELPVEKKREALLRVVVVSNEDEAKQYGVPLVGESELEQEIGATSLFKVIPLRRNSALTLTSFHQSRIEGAVRLEQKGILVLQTPFDRGWSAVQDGQTAPVLKVDIGLLGVALDAGEHRVEVRYRTPFLVHGLAISLASLLILVASIWRWPRLQS